MISAHWVTYGNFICSRVKLPCQPPTRRRDTDTWAAPANERTVGVLKAFEEPKNGIPSSSLDKRRYRNTPGAFPIDKPSVRHLKRSTAREFKYAQIPFLRGEDLRNLGLIP